MVKFEGPALKSAFRREGQLNWPWSLKV